MKRKFTFLLMALLALAGFKGWGQETITVDFESGTIPANWTLIDADGDGYNWTVTTGYSHGGSYAACSESYRGALTPDNFLVSPQLTLGTGANISFYAYSYGGYSEHIGLAVSTTGTNPSDFTVIQDWTYYNQEFKQLSVDLNAYAGQQVYLAIRHYNVSNQWKIYVDDITINLGVAGTSYNISYDNANIQHGSISGPATAYAGQTITVTATPDAGYALEHITVNSVDYLGNTFTMPEEDVTVSATFVPGLTVNDGTVVGNNNVPFNGNQAQTYPTKSEFIIPAGDLTSMQGETISSLTFYTANNTEDNDFTNGTWDVYVKEVDYTLPGGNDGYTYTAVANMTKVYSGAMSVQNHQMTIPLTTPFVYDSKNLIISFQQTAYSSTHSEVNWIGKSEGSDVRSRGGYYYGFSFTSGPSYSSTPFLPKTTFTYTSVSCPAPTGLTASNITAEGATISWNDNGAESYNLDVNGAVYENVTSPYILDVELSTTYTVKVQAVCGVDETSAWSSAINFTTPDCWDGHTINYTLNDSYGDGWNGANLTIVDKSNNNTIKTLTLSGSTESGSLTLCSGTYDFVWHKGQYDYECSFSISENDETLFTCSSATAYTNGQVVYTLDLLEKFAITLTQPETGGTISTNYEQAAAGTIVTLSANPAFGYEFGTWTVMAGEDPVTVTNNTFEMPESDVTVTATFNELTQYNITCSQTTGGAIHAEYNGETITSAPAGTVVTLVAEPNTGYAFAYFIVEDTPITSNTFTMPESNVTVSAVFSPVYSISIDMALVGGSISQMSTQGTLAAYPAGTQVFLFANPDEDYSFQENSFTVTRADGETGPTVTYEDMMYSFIMPESNVTVSATFNKTAFAVSKVITPTYSGSFSVSKTAHVGIGETVTLSNFNAYEGYYFDFEDVNSLVVKRNDNQETVEVNNYDYFYQFAMPASDVTVTATFKVLPRYSVFVGDVVNGTITVDEPYEDILAGAIVYFEVEPETGYTLESITVTPEEGNPFEPTQQYDFYYFTMPSSNVTISATFREFNTYTINYYVNGQLDRTMQCREDGLVNNDGPQNVAVPAGMTFEGWGIAEIDTYVTEKPAVLGNAEYPTQNYNLYAVLRYTEEIPAAKGGETWKKVTSTSELSAGDEIVLVYSNLVMCTRESAFYESYPYEEVTISNNEITSLPDNAAQFTLINNSGNWKLQYEELGATRILATNPTTTDLASEDLYTSWGYTLYVNWEAETYNNSVVLKNTQLSSLTKYIGYWEYWHVMSVRAIDYACQAYKKSASVITTNYYMTSVLTDGEVTANTTAKNIIITTGTVTVGEGVVLTMNENGLFRNEDAANFVFGYGAQLITNNAGVLATMKKHINGTNNWYTISSPLAADETAFADVTNLIPNSGVTGKDYDLYYLNEKDGVWVNARPETGQSSSFTKIEKGVGYIYSNTNTTDIAFKGEINVASVNRELTNDAAHGFNLIGNPFMQNIKLTDVQSDGTAVLAGGFYVLNNDETWGTKLTESEIKPLQGFLVQATTAGDVTISKPTSSSKGERSNEQNTNIEMIVSNASFKDNAYAMFGEGTGLNKVSHRNAQAPMLYVPQDGEKFAIAFMDENTTVFPVSFKAMTTGSYSISLKATDDISTLVLVDNMTGAETNMLLEESYKFIGSPADNENRFTVKLKISNSQDGDEDEHFAYQNGSELVVNGEGTLQIFDVLGRMVISEEVHGQTVNVGGLNTGAYIVRLTGESVMTQKIVVR